MKKFRILSILVVVLILVSCGGNAVSKDFKTTVDHGDIVEYSITCFRRIPPEVRSVDLDIYGRDDFFESEWSDDVKVDKKITNFVEKNIKKNPYVLVELHFKQSIYDYSELFDMSY